MLFFAPCRTDKHKFYGNVFSNTINTFLKGSGNFVLDPLEIILDLAHAAMIIINL